MNCEEGELARVVKGKLSYGRIVRCLRLATGDEIAVARCGQKLVMQNNCPTWIIDGYVCMKAENGKNFWVSFCADHNLRPIRDPGDDARDETLDWLPVPEKAITS